MIRFTCPVTHQPVTVERDELLSTHRTSTGTAAYARCDCRGMAVLEAGRDLAWSLSGHAGGTDADRGAPDAASAAPGPLTAPAPVSASAAPVPAPAGAATSATSTRTAVHEPGETAVERCA